MSKMKRILCGLLCVVMTVSVLAFSPKQVEAAKNTYDVSNAISLGTKGSDTYEWTLDNHKEVYYSFKMKNNGYVSFSVSNPMAYNIYHSQRVVILNKKLKEIWVGDSLGNLYDAEKMSYKVGLNRGDYYLCIQPQNLSMVNQSNVKTTVKLATKKDYNFETESNDTRKTANTLKLKKYKKASYGDEYDVDNFTDEKEDWFKVKVKKGKTYKITLKNYKQFNKNHHTALVDILFDKQTIDKQSLGSTLRKKGTLKVKATQSGYYYIRVWNDCLYKPFDYQLKVEQVKK
ncbi:MAG: hypothetical protein K5675_04210 [Lachnospiraceae bacterium]|nr:hypothetical protein [Lachnospiraceae bacterium]